MHDLIEWYREKREVNDINPILLAAEFHYKFICIHPFDDGNGRLARILMNFILMQNGFPPAIIKTEDKSNYFAALQQADSGIYEPFFDYIAANLVRSLEIMIAGAKGESIEEPDDLDKEIALLEQKLKAVGQPVDVANTEEAIVNIFDNSILPLHLAFIEACEKFVRFYRESVYEIVFDPIKWTSDILIAKSWISQNTRELDLNYYFKHFNRSGFGEFDHNSKINVELKLSCYIVSTPLFTLNHLYGEQLTKKDINEVVQSEVRRHMDFITQKLKEAQNKSN